VKVRVRFFAADVLLDMTPPTEIVLVVPDSTSLYTLDRTPAPSRPLQFRGPCESTGFRVSGTPGSVYRALRESIVMSVSREMFEGFRLGRMIEPPIH
jgi:hypothetical protein